MLKRRNSTCDPPVVTLQKVKDSQKKEIKAFKPYLQHENQSVDVAANVVSEWQDAN